MSEINKAKILIDNNKKDALDDLIFIIEKIFHSILPQH